MDDRANYATSPRAGIFVAAILMATTACLGSCSRPARYAGSRLGTQTIPGVFMQNRFVIQYDVGAPEGPKTPLFGIFWHATRAGEISHDHNNLLTRISGRHVLPPVNKKAIYALQLDYTLKEIPLSQAEVVQLLTVADQGGSLWETPLWRAKVASKLKVVEPY